MMLLQNSYATEESFNAYINYLALKRHFSSDDYDYHKYNGKVRASFQSFKTRNDAFFFYKLSQKKDWRNLQLANIIQTPSIWIRDLCEPNAEQVYFDWKKKIDAISHHFSSELSNLDNDLSANFVTDRGSHPLLITLFLRKRISKETFAIVSHLCNVYPYWDENLSSDVIARDVIRFGKKYYPFLSIDKKKFSTMLKSYVS